MMLEIPNYSQPFQVAQQDLLSIKGGIETAKTYPTRANSRMALFDEDDDVFYIVKTDQNGYKPEIRRFRYVEEPIESQNGSYASKEDFNSLKEELGDVKQSIQQLTEAINTRRNNSGKYRNNNRGTVEATIVDG